MKKGAKQQGTQFNELYGFGMTLRLEDDFEQHKKMEHVSNGFCLPSGLWAVREGNVPLVHALLRVCFLLHHN